VEDRVSHDGHDNPWRWRDGHDPYHRTPLQVLGIAPDLTGRSAVRAAARRRRLRVERGADRFPLFGCPVELAEVNEAEQELTTATGRLLAELRTHRPSRHQQEDLRAQWDALAADFARLPGAETPETPDASPAVRPEGLLGWLPTPPPRLPRRPGDAP
jgi:hypothetical protein